MSQEKTNLEIIAPTVDEAVARGLSQLGLSADAVDVEILDAGSRGLFGLGSRQARIKLTIKSPKTQSPSVQSPQMKTPVSSVPSGSAAAGSAPVKPAARNAAPSGSAPTGVAPSGSAPSGVAPSASTAEPVVAKRASEDTPGTPSAKIDVADDDRNLQVARDIVSELLEKMRVKATVTARYIESSDSGEEQQILVDVQGDDLSILIGRRTETLNALQYIASLIVGKELEHWVPLLIDVQGYRSRRERQLRQLARRMADQAVQSGKRQVLEPMPANERRIIHLELRDHAQVITESQGDEPNRKVTITLKKQ